MGLAIFITQKFVLAPVHAHVLLLGWASLALAGIVYHVYRPASATRLARMHFWLHNLGVPVFMIGLALLLTGTEAGNPITAVGATVVLVGLALFSANVIRQAGSA